MQKENEGLKIFYIAHFDCTGNGGHVDHVKGVVKELATGGNQIFLFSSGCDFENENIHFVRVPQLKKGRFYSISFCLSMIFHLVKYLFWQKPDVVYSRYFNTLALLAVLIRLFNVPYFVELNSHPKAEHKALNRGMLRRAFEKYSEIICISLSASVVAVSSSIQNYVRHNYPTTGYRCVLIENGVDVSVFLPIDMKTVRQRLGLDQQVPIVVFVGAFQSWQGLDDLVIAANKVLAFDSRVLFYLVGSGKEEEAIRAKIAELSIAGNVLLTGELKAREAVEYICASNVCVAPYNLLAADPAGLKQRYTNSYLSMKGSPIKIFAYLSCSKPVVTTNFFETGYVLNKIGAGISVPPNDCDSLAKAICDLISSPDKAIRMGQNGFAYVRSQCTWRHTAKKIQNYICYALSKREGRDCSRC